MDPLGVTFSMTWQLISGSRVLSLRARFRVPFEEASFPKRSLLGSPPFNLLSWGERIGVLLGVGLAGEGPEEGLKGVAVACRRALLGVSEAISTSPWLGVCDMTRVSVSGTCLLGVLGTGPVCASGTCLLGVLGTGTICASGTCLLGVLWTGTICASGACLLGVLGTGTICASGACSLGVLGTGTICASGACLVGVLETGTICASGCLLGDSYSGTVSASIAILVGVLTSAPATATLGTGAISAFLWGLAWCLMLKGGDIGTAPLLRAASDISCLGSAAGSVLAVASRRGFGSGPEAQRINGQWK